MKAYMKEHKIVVAAAIFLLIAVCMLFIVNRLFFVGKSKVAYGNRLKGIEKVKITKEDKNSLISSIEKNDMVKKCSYSLQGKIVNLIITVNDDVSVGDAKALGNQVLESFDDDQKKFYDFQIFIKKENEDGAFPIIGYKQNTKDSYSWTKDR